MTTEEKAKAWDEAIERAKSKIRNDKDHVLYEEDILDIFPSLKESDDERIRKEIIEDYRSAKRLCREGEEGSKRILDEKIAWLEKQGERPNNVYDKELSENLDAVIRRYINDPSIPDAVRGMVKREIIPYVERLEKQGEQKPVVIIPKFRIGDIFRAKGSNTEYHITEISDGYYRGLGWFLDIIEGDKSDDYELVEQKPQSTWKPSDGQMKALKEACDEHWEPDGFDPLYTLYQDLKKLKVE